MREIDRARDMTREEQDIEERIFGWGAKPASREAARRKAAKFARGEARAAFRSVASWWRAHGEHLYGSGLYLVRTEDATASESLKKLYFWVELRRLCQRLERDRA